MHGADRSRIGGGSHASPARHDEVPFDLGHSTPIRAQGVRRRQAPADNDASGEASEPELYKVFVPTGLGRCHV